MKRAQMIVSEVTSCEGIMRSALLLGLTIILFIALFGLVSTPALAKGHGRHHKHPRACSKTATAAFLACENGKKDDYWIAQGNCYNSASEDQAECFAEAKKDYKDARQECRDQLDARKDLCDELGEEPYNPDIGSLTFEDPANIGGSVDPNPYFPLVPGYMWTYKTRDATDTVIETNTVEVLAPAVEGVTIEGIPCAVVHDIVYEGDTTDPAAIIEDTHDYYAQQDDGTVWYFGEFSQAKEECDGELCQGLYSIEGSWQSGFEGGEPGIIMFADPSAVGYGTVYRQELYLGEAEDAAEVVNFDEESVTVPYGSFNSQLLKTKDFSPLEPGVGDYKYYAPGIGVIIERAYEDDNTTGERNELESINFTP